MVSGEKVTSTVLVLADAVAVFTPFRSVRAFTTAFSQWAHDMPVTCRVVVCIFLSFLMGGL